MKYEDEYYEDDIAKCKITFADITDKEREKVFKNFAQAAYNLCLYEYKRNLKGDANTNEDSTLDS